MRVVGVGYVLSSEVVLVLFFRDDSVPVGRVHFVYIYLS